MTLGTYNFRSLRQHTEAARRESAEAVRQAGPALEVAFTEFGAFVNALFEQPRSVARNVRLLLACRFSNHVYSGIVLAEAGLFADAVLCERSALETLAAYRLLCLKPELAEEYASGHFPRPVEVRRQLESAGFAHEAQQIRDLYGAASSVIHVSRDAERFNVRWETSSDGQIIFGGSYSRTDLDEMLRFLGALLHWFPMPLGDRRDRG